MTRVFVFPTSNWVGLEIIHALCKSNKIEVLGGSSYDATHDPSRLLLDTHVQCPGYEDADFDERFAAILEQHDVDLVFPAWDRLIARFADWDLPGVKFVVPNAVTARRALSKRATYDAVGGAVATPRRFERDPVAFPAFGKPDDGSGSKSTMMIANEAELRVAREKELFVTEYLPGEEFTADCLCDLEGRFLFGNVRVRGRIGEGVALGSRCVERPDILEACRTIAGKIRIEGPWFAQFKLDNDGIPTLLEVNTRIAGSSGLTRLAGVNIPLISVFLFTGEQVKVPKLYVDTLVNRNLAANVEVAPFRWVLWDLDDTLLRKDGLPDPDSIACLFDCNNRGIEQILITKNTDTDTILRERQIPNFFRAVRETQNKVEEIERILAEFAIDPLDCIMVNDAYSEIFEIQARIPDLRNVTPDALRVLGREGVR